MRRIPFVQYGRRVFVKGSSQNLAGRTGEHAWQAAKYLETAPEMAAKITAAATVDEAHTLSHTEGIDKHRQDWDEAKYDILVSVPAPCVVGGAVVALGCVAQRVGLSSAPCGCVQVGLLRAKFSQHEGLRAQLLETVGREIVNVDTDACEPPPPFPRSRRLEAT